MLIVTHNTAVTEHCYNWRQIRGNVEGYRAERLVIRTPRSVL
jgi:hypothetical protein